MHCPHCQIPLTASQHQNVDVNNCPKCHGLWVTSENVDKFKADDTLVSNDNKSTSVDEKQADKQKKRKYQHFLSGAFDY